MGYHKKTVVSLFRCALLIPSLLTPWVTASSPAHHAPLNQADRGVGNEDLHVKSIGYMSEETQASAALSLPVTSTASTHGGTTKKDIDYTDFDVDVKSLFPEGHILSNSSNLQYGLTALGGSKSGAIDTASSRSGYLLAVGESHGLTQLRKRDGQPDPFVFLDCPANVLDQPANQTQKARVVCTSEDVDGCFRVMERGVEGTLVEMPEECAPNSFARAVSIELAEDQTMPNHLTKQNTTTSPIYEFSFDFNKHELRDDAKVAIRIDMTNIKGHWDGFLDSPGIEKRDVEGKYLLSLQTDWKNTLQHGNQFQSINNEGPYRVVKDLSTQVFWQASDSCPVGDENYHEGIGAFIQGNVDANIFYAITVIASSTKGSSTVDVEDAHGFIHVTGHTDLTFGVGGVGRLDIGLAGQGNPAKSGQFYEGFQSQTISAGALWGTMKLTPYIRRQTYLATSPMDGFPSTGLNHEVALNGRLITQVKTELGDFPASFPRVMFEDELDRLRKHHKKTEMETLSSNELYGDGGERGSTIQIGHNLTFGLDLFFNILPDIQGQQPVQQSSPASLRVASETEARWDIPPAKDGTVCPHSSSSSLLRQGIVNKYFLGWKKYNDSAILFADNSAPHHELCYSTKRKRSIEDFPSPGNQSAPISTKAFNKRGIWGPKHYLGPVNIFGYVIGALFFGRKKPGDINCKNGRCATCLDFKDPDGCCGCVCMQCIWGPRGDIPPCEKCTSEEDKNEAPWPGTHVKRDRISGNNVPAPKGEGWAHFLKNPFSVRARTVTPGWKDVKVNGVSYAPPKKGNSAPFKYPMFPQDVKKVWEGADGGIYDSISYYWGNTTADCTDWSLGLNKTRDMTHDPVRDWIPSAYESKSTAETYSINMTTNTWSLSQAEHVYEGQNMGQFFTQWLTKGQIERQTPHPGLTNGKVDAAWVEDWIMSSGEDLPWTNPVDPGEEYSLFGLIHSELGNNYHKDRLAILQARLNRKKENVFDLSNFYSDDKYRLKMSHDQQWSTVKEIGLTFNYLNNDTIWDMWCDTYSGVYDWLEKFDQFYTVVKGPGDPDVSLAEEWGKYNRVVLDSAVKINGDGWDWAFENRHTNNPAMRFSREEAIWQAIRARNPKADVFHLKKSCRNLPPTTIV
ncbi:uncharacterized protein FSUBG_9582 [Fusarium subglutinans]|uniref:Uncharacterized protein n=1 Tax=Gibberella subglutinans TaxID=42677 RepID=A0A8H5PC94_GIBSU|nr:uncharacterized protein FSUBG_9582 [Fusarium subglutinans]KAF5594009.1 hypothetical protein FSUBG_9582 [Fusarium subglutinans]